MAIFMEGDLREFRKKAEAEDADWAQWMKDRKVKKCKCGNIYSYGYETNYNDPGSCPGCGNRLGEIR